MMAGHLLHSGGEGGIGEERHKLRSETCVSYWTRLADSLIVTGIQHWHNQWRQYEGNRIIQHRGSLSQSVSEPTLSLWDHLRMSLCAAALHTIRYYSPGWPVLHTPTHSLCWYFHHLFLSFMYYIQLRFILKQKAELYLTCVLFRSTCMFLWSNFTILTSSFSCFRYRVGSIFFLTML